jgi:phage gpG-like protein
MGLTLTIRKNDISPAITKLARTAKNPQRVLRAMGTTFMSITMGNFRQDTSYRPTPWAPKRSGAPSYLMLHNVLSRSFHLEVSATTAKVSNPCIYAAIHQFGGIIKPKTKAALKFKWGPDKSNWATVQQVRIPPRPFFPIIGSPGNYKLTDKAQEKIRAAGERTIKSEAE